jgi:hypothetical protein
VIIKFLKPFTPQQAESYCPSNQNTDNQNTAVGHEKVQKSFYVPLGTCHGTSATD